MMIAEILLLAASITATVSERLDVKQAEFLWTAEGDTTFVQGYIVECNGDQSPLLDPSRFRYPVDRLVKENNVTYRCTVGAVDSGKIVSESNEVSLVRQGRWVYRIP